MARKPTRPLAFGVLGLVVLMGGTAACSATQAAVPTTASVATTTTTAASPSTTAAPTATATTSTTLGSEPAGQDGAYPSQPEARLDADGTPDPSWLTEAATLDAQAAANPSAQLVFLGDSITEGWEYSGLETWDALWVPRDSIALGIVSDTTQNLLWRIQNGALAGLHPRAVVLLIGTNDIGQGWTPAQVAQGIVACAEAVRAAVPGAAIELLTVFPRDTPTSSANIAVEATNAALTQDQLPTNTALVDMTPALSTSDGGPIPLLFGDDLVHPNSAGYEVIAGRLMAIPVLAQDPATSIPATSTTAG